MPNDGKILNESKKYAALFTAVDGETMKVAVKFVSMATSTLPRQVLLVDLLQLRGGCHHC